MWRTPIYDRTEADVQAGADKCYVSAALLNRIEENTAYIAELLGLSVTSRAWTQTDLLTRSEAQRILDNLAAVRQTYHVLPGTPDLPDAPSTLYTDINAMEQVQWSMHELWQRNSQKQYTGEICAGQAIGVM